MIDFKSFQQVETQIVRRNQQRGLQGDNLYQEACDLLEKYRHSSDPHQLEKALQILVECTQTNSAMPEPHMLLAYLLYGLGDYQRGMQAFKTAESLAPQLPFIQDLKALFSQAELIPLLEDQSEQEQRQLEDEQLDQFEAVLKTLDAHIAPVELDLFVSLEQAIESLHYKNLYYQALQDWLTFSVDQLEPIFDMHEYGVYQQKLATITTGIKHQYHQCLTYYKIKREIQSYQSSLKLMQQFLLGEEPELNCDVETLFDSCDLIANQLDPYEHATDRFFNDILNSYHGMLSITTAFQELLEERDTAA